MLNGGLKMKIPHHFEFIVISHKLGINNIDSILREKKLFLILQIRHRLGMPFSEIHNCATSMSAD